jgi:hypothetical protein
MVGASHLDSFEELLKGATEANAETIDTLTLLIKGHTQRWAICMEAGSDKLMSQRRTASFKSLGSFSIIPFTNLQYGSVATCSSGVATM